MNPNLQRGILHYQQHRLDMAEQEFRLAMASEPQDPMAHGFLAMCLADRERFEEATTEARQAVHLGPDFPGSYYSLAYVLEERQHLEEAKAAICEAIRIQPDHCGNWARLASIELQQRNWRGALEAAERGLQHDPEHSDCTNLRAMALVKLGRRDEAGASIQAALHRNPQNAATHANMGWTLLHSNNPKMAMEHFREALRLDPTMEHARFGIVEAMKARHIVYRYLLMYFLWMARLSGRAQWGVIIGLYVIRGILKSLAEANPKLLPFVTPVLILYVAFALLTWIGEPLFNLLLRFNRFGKFALSRSQIQAANLLALCLGLAVVSLGFYFWRRSAPALVLGLVCAAMAVPISATWRRPAGWLRNSLAIYTTLLAVAGLVSVIAACYQTQSASDETAGSIFTFSLGLFAVGWFLFGWVANAVGMVRVKR